MESLLKSSKNRTEMHRETPGVHSRFPEYPVQGVPEAKQRRRKKSRSRVWKAISAGTMQSRPGPFLDGTMQIAPGGDGEQRTFGPRFSFRHAIAIMSAVRAGGSPGKWPNPARQILLNYLE